MSNDNVATLASEASTAVAAIEAEQRSSLVVVAEDERRSRPNAYMGQREYRDLVLRRKSKRCADNEAEEQHVGRHATATTNGQRGEDADGTAPRGRLLLVDEPRHEVEETEEEQREPPLLQLRRPVVELAAYADRVARTSDEPLASSSLRRNATGYARPGLAERNEKADDEALTDDADYDGDRVYGNGGGFLLVNAAAATDDDDTNDVAKTEAQRRRRTAASLFLAVPLLRTDCRITADNRIDVRVRRRCLEQQPQRRRQREQPRIDGNNAAAQLGYYDVNDDDDDDDGDDETQAEPRSPTKKPVSSSANSFHVNTADVAGPSSGDAVTMATRVVRLTPTDVTGTSHRDAVTMATRVVSILPTDVAGPSCRDVTVAVATHEDLAAKKSATTRLGHGVRANGNARSANGASRKRNGNGSRGNKQRRGCVAAEPIVVDVESELARTSAAAAAVTNANGGTSEPAATATTNTGTTSTITGTTTTTTTTEELPNGDQNATPRTTTKRSTQRATSVTATASSSRARSKSSPRARKAPATRTASRRTATTAAATAATATTSIASTSYASTLRINGPMITADECAGVGHGTAIGSSSALVVGPCARAFTAADATSNPAAFCVVGRGARTRRNGDAQRRRRCRHGCPSPPVPPPPLRRPVPLPPMHVTSDSSSPAATAAATNVLRIPRSPKAGGSRGGNGSGRRRAAATINGAAASSRIRRTGSTASARTSAPKTTTTSRSSTAAAAAAAAARIDDEVPEVVSRTPAPSVVASTSAVAVSSASRSPPPADVKLEVKDEPPSSPVDGAIARDSVVKTEEDDSHEAREDVSVLYESPGLISARVSRMLDTMKTEPKFAVADSTCDAVRASSSVIPSEGSAFSRISTANGVNLLRGNAQLLSSSLRTPKPQHPPQHRSSRVVVVQQAAASSPLTQQAASSSPTAKATGSYTDGAVASSCALSASKRTRKRGAPTTDQVEANATVTTSFEGPTRAKIGKPRQQQQQQPSTNDSSTTCPVVQPTCNIVDRSCVRSSSGSNSTIPKPSSTAVVARSSKIMMSLMNATENASGGNNLMSCPEPVAAVTRNAPSSITSTGTDGRKPQQQQQQQQQQQTHHHHHQPLTVGAIRRELKRLKPPKMPAIDAAPVEASTLRRGEVYQHDELMRERDFYRPDRLNVQQRAIFDYVTEHPSGRVLIQAGPGTGKTFTLMTIAHASKRPVSVLIYKHDLLDSFKYVAQRFTIASFFMKLLSLRFYQYMALERQLSGRMNASEFVTVVISLLRRSAMPALRGSLVILDEYTMIPKPLLLVVLLLMKHHGIGLIVCGDRNQLQNIHNSPHAMCSSYDVARRFVDREFGLAVNVRCAHGDYNKFIDYVATFSSDERLDDFAFALIAAVFPRQMHTQATYTDVHLAATHRELARMIHGTVIAEGIPTSFYRICPPVRSLAVGMGHSRNATTSLPDSYDLELTSEGLLIPKMVTRYRQDRDVDRFLPYLPLRVGARYFVLRHSEFHQATLVAYDETERTVTMQTDSGSELVLGQSNRHDAIFDKHREELLDGCRGGRLYNYPIYPANVMSIHKCQGCTIRGRLNVCLHETSYRGLYVTLSRVQDPSQIGCVTMPQMISHMVSSVVQMPEHVSNAPVPVEKLIERMRRYVFYQVNDGAYYAQLLARFFHAETKDERRRIREQLMRDSVKERQTQLTPPRPDRQSLLLNQTIQRFIDHEAAFMRLVYIDPVDRNVWLHEYAKRCPDLINLRDDDALDDDYFGSSSPDESGEMAGGGASSTDSSHRSPSYRFIDEFLELQDGYRSNESTMDYIRRNAVPVSVPVDMLHAEFRAGLVDLEPPEYESEVSIVDDTSSGRRRSCDAVDAEERKSSALLKPGLATTPFRRDVYLMYLRSVPITVPWLIDRLNEMDASPTSTAEPLQPSVVVASSSSFRSHTNQAPSSMPIQRLAILGGPIDAVTATTMPSTSHGSLAVDPFATVTVSSELNSRKRRRTTAAVAQPD